MNCADIARILNESDLQQLSAAEREQVDAHCAGCAECAGDREIHARIASAVIPALPASLRHWHPDAAGKRPGKAAGRRRTLIVPLLLLAGAAAAMLALLSTLESEPEAGAVAMVDGEGITTPDTGAVTATDDAGEIGAAPVESRNPVAVTDEPRHRLVIWPIQYEDEATASVQMAEAAHRAVVRFFRAQANLEVIEATPAQYDAARAAVGAIENPGRSVTAGVTMLGSGVTRAMALELGAEYSVQLASGSLGIPGGWSIGLAYVSPTGVGSGSSSGGLAGDNPGEVLNNIESVATDRAQRTYASLFPESSAPLIESVVLDSARSDADRLDAIDTLLRSAPRLSADGAMQRTDISPAVLAAAIELGRSSASAETRRRIWEQLGQTGNPQLTQPLTDALLYDADDAVRAVAADALTEFRAEPAVRAALESVAVGEASPELRLRARWSVLDDADRIDHAVVTLLDPGLTIAERMAPVMLARARRARSIPFVEPRDYAIPALEGAALEAIAGIAEGDHDDPIRQAALFELGFAGHPDFVELLFDRTDAELRRSVLMELRNRRGTPGVLERVDQAVAAEPDADVRQLLENVLSPPEFLTRPPTAE